MEISKIPRQYAPVETEAIYSITGAHPGQVLEAEIFVSGETSPQGIKKLHGAGRYDVNISAYIRGAISTEPLAGRLCGIYPAPGRVVAATVKTGTEVSDEVKFTGGKNPKQMLSPLSLQPGPATLARGEHDEIAFLATTGCYVCEITFDGEGLSHRISLPGVSLPEGMAVIAVNFDDLDMRLAREGLEAGSFNSMEVSLAREGVVLFSRHYALEAHDPSAARIAWINPAGGVDCFTFRYAGEESLRIKRTEVTTANGPVVTGGEGETQRRFTSGYQPRETIRFIAALALSPAVWITGNNGARRVGISVGETITTDTEGLAKMELMLISSL